MFPSRFILVFSFAAPLGCSKDPLRSEQAVGFCLLVGRQAEPGFPVGFLLPSFLRPLGVPELCRSSYFVFFAFPFLHSDE